MSLWGNKDQANNAPSYLSEREAGKVYFVDTTEAGVASNKAKGLGTSGWNLYETYVDANGNTRHKSEVLVAMSTDTSTAGDSGAIILSAGDMTANTEYTIVETGNTDFTAVGAANNDVGTTFTANNSAGGTGTVAPTEDDIVADS